MPNTLPNSNEPKLLTPKELADQLFEAASSQAQGNYRAAAEQVIMFLTEGLVYAMTAMTAGDEAARKALFKSVSESIVGLLSPPPSP